MTPNPAPYKVVVYDPGTRPVAEFTGYRSIAAAQAWAEVLREQTCENNWPYTFEVRK